MRVQLRTGYFYQHHVPALSFGCIRRHEIEEQRSQQEKNTRQVYNLHLDVVQCTSRSPRFLSSIQYDRELNCTHQGWHMHLSNGVCRVVSRRHDSYVRAPNINTIGCHDVMIDDDAVLLRPAGPCNEIFPPGGEMEQLVRETDPWLFEKLGYSSCCSRSDHTTNFVLD